MSFITKRDRVFNEYDLLELPARNEGKLKAYASCTDTRAWSHFCSDKSEHLVDIIKRNNETCRPKYVPTDAIVNTLMAAKNTEIGRLKRKIEEFEQMLSAYDQLELTCDQKCEIANAHAAIKAANKELDDMCLDLDLSGYTEGIDSEAFETGKSRGDEASINTAHGVPKSKKAEWEYEKDYPPMMETKANQTEKGEPCDASTSAHDARIDELQDVIITKDAKLSAMQNTLAVMENDICEPYCIYAHIYTALEKIFGTLCQNSKYKEYLDLLTAGKDTRGIDVKGKILFKLKVLEKFSMALIAPCSQDYPSQTKQECSCYYAEINTVDINFALTSPTSRKSHLDSKRALLVADIMENQEIKEILSKDSLSTKIDDDQIDESYSIETENLNRLKNLQANYEDLLNCYENLKYEKSCLQSKCNKYKDLEKDFERLKSRLQDYKLLWNEKEHYKKRSEDLDTLKEKFLVLSEETSNIETQLLAESEKNINKTKAVDELRSENIALEKKLNDMVISFEKEKSNLTCKLKEYECKMMCQEQQIKSLSMQIDHILEQDKTPSNYDSIRALELNNQIDSLKQQVLNLRNALFCEEEEKQQLQEEFEKKLTLINELKMEIEDWKSNYDKAIQKQNYLEKYTKKYQNEMEILKEENVILSKDIERKTNDIDTFITIINNKSEEINNLMNELEQRKNDNQDLYLQLQKATESFDQNLCMLENEKKSALFSLQLARTDSQKLIDSYEEACDHQNQFDDANNTLDIREDTRSFMGIVDRNSANSILIQEIQKLRADNKTNISKLQEENITNKKSLEILKKESGILKEKLLNLENLSQQFHRLKESHDRLVEDKIKLENDLQNRASELENVLHLTRKDSETLLKRLQQSEFEQRELNNNYEIVISEKNMLQSDLSDKEAQLKILTEKLVNLHNENERLRHESQLKSNFEQQLRKINNDYESLQKEYISKTNETANLYKNLDQLRGENQKLNCELKDLQLRDVSSKTSIIALENEKSSIKIDLKTLKEQSAELISKLKYYEDMENDMMKLKLTQDQVKLENERLQDEMEQQKINLESLEDQNRELKKIISSSTSSRELLDIKKEIENIKQEKIKNLEKIKELRDKLDNSECIISQLTENLYARDDKISLLENYINELQDEVQRLHSVLENLSKSSEEIKDHSIQNITESLKRVEAHHSKATHNMRSEIAKLQNQNFMLENQLSATKVKSEESIRDMYDYASQIECLQNEREEIVRDIRELEIKSLGESNLSPRCNIEDVIASITRVNNYIESNKSKNVSLEKTLLKVQSSFQLVLDKADEEKRNIDVEQQNLLREKEEAILDLQNLERKFIELKQKYEKQTTEDRRIINDLEAEILNQNLIIDKINQSKTDYISRLEEDIQSLQNMYKASISKVAELQATMQDMSMDSNRNKAVIDETNLLLREKCKEIEILKNTLQNISLKSIQDVSTQALIINQEIDQKSTQTHNESENQLNEPVPLEDLHKIGNDFNNINNKNINKHSKDPISEILPKNEPYSINEVQILRADVDSTLLYQNRTAYIDFKKKRLSYGRMEQCSITSFNNGQDSNIEKFTSNEDEVNESNLKDSFNKHKTSENSKTIDVYNLQPHYVRSTKQLKTQVTKLKTPTNLSSNSLCDIKTARKLNETIDKDIGSVKKHKSDKDIFVVYNDSNSNSSPTEHKNELQEIYKKSHSLSSHLSDSQLVEAKKNKKSKNKNSFQNNDSINLKKYSNKPKLQIELPRIAAESSSKTVSTDSDNKSIDSYTYAIYSSPKTTAHRGRNINIKPESSNTPLYGSPNTFDKLSNEEKIHDIFIQNQESERNLFESNNQLSNEDNVSLLRVTSEQVSTENSFNNDSNQNTLSRKDSRHKLSRVGANMLLIEYSDDRSTSGITSSNQKMDSQETLKSVNFGLQYILDTMNRENDPQNERAYKYLKSLLKITNYGTKNSDNSDKENGLELHKLIRNTFPENESPTSFKNLHKAAHIPKKSCHEFGVSVKMDPVEEYEKKISHLTKALQNIERNYKKKIDAVKTQYNCNIKSIINEHNQGVISIQCLHEETLQDVIKIHENEVENLRTMSIEALRKVEKLEQENHALKTKIYDYTSADLDKEPVKIPTPEVKSRRGRSQVDTKTLTKTNVEAFNVHPKAKSHGPCTCTIDMNISDTIRNIFEQVDADQRKVAENAYLKYIANKISTNNIEDLDAQELSFLHLKVCRTWKTKLSKEEALQKRIDSLESELIRKQRQAQQHMAELDRKVAEERRRLQEVREAVCRDSPSGSRDGSPEPLPLLPPQTTDTTTATEKNSCQCNQVGCNPSLSGRRSAGDLGPGLSGVSKNKRSKVESNRAVLAKMNSEERRDRKFFDDPPIRLKRYHDRPNLRKK